MVDTVVKLRLENKTREEIAAITGFPLGRVKKILSNAGVVLPMETRQANAYRSKLAKNPDAMKQMRKSLTPEVVRRRSESIRIAYEKEDLKKLKGQQSVSWWASIPEENKADMHQFKTGEKSTRVQAILNTEGFTDMKARYVDLVKEKGKMLGDYFGSHVETSWQCKKGHVFNMMPYVVTNGHWCPSCSHVGPSVAQLEIYEYVKALIPGQEVLIGSREFIKPLELDIYVPGRRLAIEYDGLLHHSDYFGGKNGRHLRKFQACDKADIDLLAIFEDEWQDKRELVKAMIAWRLGAFAGQKHRASDLVLGPVDTVSQQAFFDKNHLDGYARASQAWGLFLAGRLIQCISLRKNFAGEQEICRIATDYQHHVHGGAARLMTALRASLKPEAALITYSNNRLSRGEVYAKNGFHLLKENGSSYWYTDGKVRIWRWKCRRQNKPEVLGEFPTEKQQALGGVFSEKLFGDRRPLYRIEDYGHRKWILVSARM